jgi:RHS repeat-associated protein
LRFNHISDENDFVNDLNSALASNRLLHAKIYPESDDRPAPLSDGPDGVYARLEYTYNKQGDATTFKDADGTIHAYSYDKLGRQTEDRVTELASHLNGAVRRIETSFNVRGLLHQVTSFDAASGGTVLNQVERLYDAFNNLIEDRQAHDGAVDGSTLKVQYAHISGAGNQLRRTALTYPNGRQLSSQYGSANSIDDHLNRISALQVNGETDPLVNYTYAGLAWQVVVGLPQPEIELNYKRQSGAPVSDAGDIYFGYDRFGRSIDLRWQKAGTPLVHLQYGFDANSRRTWRNDLVAPSTAQQDRHYGYDTLSQIIAEDRGDLNVNRTAIAGNPASGSRWHYDETGNWQRYEQLANGTTTLDQPRTHDKGNRLLEVGAGAGAVRVDRAGRMLELPPVEGAWDETFEIVWDAWSRIVEVKQGESTVGKYTYDGLTRRITRETGGELIHTYYSDTWRTLEDRVTDAETPGTPTLQAHYLWGARHRDDLVRRDHATSTPGTFDETRYVLMDYFSPAAITDEEGAISERYAFSAFGLRSVLAPDYTSRSLSESAFEFAFQGQFEDSETGWLNYGYRYYIPALGRWPSKDWIGERGGLNLYRMALNNPSNITDLLGAAPCGEGEQKDPDCVARAIRRLNDRLQNLMDNFNADIEQANDSLIGCAALCSASALALARACLLSPNPPACELAAAASYLACMLKCRIDFNVSVRNAERRKDNAWRASVRQFETDVDECPCVPCIDDNDNNGPGTGQGPPVSPPLPPPRAV